MVQKKARNLQNKKFTFNSRADGVEVTFYTDPLCCWSWAMQSHWKQLRERFAGTFSLQYKMAGLLPSWNNFTDSRNSIRRPAQMGPEWLHASELTGVSIDPSIWVSDPPASSFPACIAVKCAELQSREAGEYYFYLLQEAVMADRRNIARADVLIELAALVPAQFPFFNLNNFREDLLDHRGKDAFRIDWQESKYKSITRLPTAVFRAVGSAPMLLSGFQTYEALEKTILSLKA